MKLASLKGVGRDGLMAVVSRDLTKAILSPPEFPTLRSAIEDWPVAEPCLRRLSEELNHAVQNGKAFPGAFDFDVKCVAAPLPRAFQWCDGSAFLAHGKRMQKAFALPPIPDEDVIPLMYQGASDDLIGPTDDIVLPDAEHGIDFEGEFGVIVDDVPMGCREHEAIRHIKLIIMFNDISLRNLQPREMKTGFGLIQSKPVTAFAPVAVTPDELGAAWKDGRVHLDLHVWRNEEHFGHPNGGEMSFHFMRLISHLTATRRLGAGTIIGSGTVSSWSDDVGSACISERRAIEMLRFGKPRTPYLAFGERIRMDVSDARGQTVFGTINQKTARF
jgi:fumarylacetoacetate (FAA) hydrolase